MVSLQERRDLAFYSPLGEDVLLFHRASGSEGQSELFAYEVEVLSEDHNLRYDDILGQNVAIRLKSDQGGDRYFNGMVTEFAYLGASLDHAHYRIVMRPWLWLLTRSVDCRIHQRKTVPQIIEDCFREAGFTDFKSRLMGEYQEHEYRVQFKESLSDFLMRLMEEEGIYFYFQHEKDKHNLILADSYSAHDVIPDYEEVPYNPEAERRPSGTESIFQWSMTDSLQSGSFALNAYDFEKPKSNRLVKSSDPPGHAHADFEVYDYSDDYVEPGVGESYAKIRMEERKAQFQLARAEGEVRGLTPGGLFKLVNHPRDDLNREYLVVSAGYEMQSDAYLSSSDTDGAEIFRSSFTAIDSQTPFRPPRVTPKPLIKGPQTATVVGKKGEEIWTDDYGRVKVQFHWDREGKNDENSSRWIRVSQPWAGKNWGGIAIPRIGQEVMVDFIEGDPDRPLISGRVYNKENMPPYSLPDNKTQSGIKSRSSQRGSPDNFNEIRFEDKKGEEQVYIHAEKNQDNVVENDETIAIGHDRTETVGNDEAVTIANNRTHMVGRNHTESVGSNMTITVAQNLTEAVGINYAETVGAAMELTVGAAMIETVCLAKTQSVGADKSESVGKSKTVDIGDDKSEKVGKSKSVNVGEDYSETVGKAHRLSAETVSVVAKEQVNVKTGKAAIQMKKNGDITISGKKITIKGSGDVIIKGKKILQN